MKQQKIHKKAILLIADGLGDRPIKELGDRTPLEYASTPTLDLLCRQGVSGLVHPYRPGARVGTDWGHLCIFGYDPQSFYTGRGSIEATSAGLSLIEGDVAFRGNFATVANDLSVIDRRAGRIRELEAIEQLVATIDGTEIDGCTFLVRPLTEHRLAVVMRGDGLWGSVPDTDPGTAREGEMVVNPSDNCAPQVERTASLLWKFLLQVYHKWDQHPVNALRRERGEPPANFILTRGSGSAMVLPPFTKSFPGVRGACLAGDVTITGIARMCGLDGYSREGFTGGFDTDYMGKAQLALRLLEQYDFVVVHIKATDLCGHDNLPQKKAQILENIDAMFRFWLDHIAVEQTYLGMTADHSTPCHYREHSADPVPTFLWGANLRRDDVMKYSERDCQPGLLTGYTGAQFTATIMDYLGFTKKFGA